MNQWIMAGASSIGKSHLDSQLPNQDSLFFQRNEQFLVAVVCDGAGSAMYSQDGARFFAEQIGQYLVDLGTTLTHQISQAQAPSLETGINSINTNKLCDKANISDSLSTIRERLAEQISTISDVSLKDYHSTVTAALILPELEQGLLLQIGDSPLITSRFKVADQYIDYFVDMQYFGEDDKDEYVNETHFITQDNWQQQLRLMWLDLETVDLLALMTDGCGDLIFEGGKLPRTIYRPFFGNLMFNLLQASERHYADTIIQTTLDNPATYRLTGDDKSLVVLYRQSVQGYQGLEPVIEVAQISTVPNDTQTVSVSSNPSIWQTAENTRNNTENPFNQNQHLPNHLDSPQSIPMVSKEQSSQSALPPIQKNPLIAVDTTALPTPVTMPNKSNKTAILVASGAVVAIVGLLGLNKELLLNKFASKSQISDTRTNAAPISASAATETTVMQTRLPEFSIATPLKINNLATAQAEGAVVSLILGFTNGTFEAPVTKSLVLEHLPEGRVMARLTCNPIAQNLNSSLVNQGIIPNPAWQYAECVLTLDAHNDKNQKITMPAQFTQMTLAQGLVPFFAQSHGATSSTTLTASVQQVIYYLPTKIVGSNQAGIGKVEQN